MDEATLLKPSSPTDDPAAIVPDEAIESREKSLVLSTCLGHAICHLGEMMFPCVMVAVMLEFSMAQNHATFIALWGYVLLGVGALPVGWWVDKWDPARILFIYLVLMAAMGLVVAFAPTKLALFIALTGLGCAASIYHPAGLAMLSMTKRARGRAMGINGVAGSCGVAIAPIVGSIAVYFGSWRYAYVVVAVAAILVACYMLTVLKTLSAAIAREKQSATDAQTAATAAAPKRKRRYLPLALALGVMMLGGMNYRCLVTALPSYLMGDAAVKSKTTAAKSTDAEAKNAADSPKLTSLKDVVIEGGFLAFVVLSAGGIGQLLGGWLADRFGPRNVYILLAGSMIPTAFLLGLSGGSMTAVVFGSLLAVGLFGQQPVENSLLAEYTSTTRRSRSYALKFVLTFGVGAFGAQIVGQIWKSYEALEPVFYMIAGSAVVMVVLLICFMTVTQARKQEVTQNTVETK